MKPPKTIRVHIPLRGWLGLTIHEEKTKCYTCEINDMRNAVKDSAQFSDPVDYILLSEHEKELNKIWKTDLNDFSKQLAEKNKEIENYKGADQINKTMARESVAEKQDLLKAIDHWKSSYNQAADERNQLRIDIEGEKEIRANWMTIAGKQRKEIEELKKELGMLQDISEGLAKKLKIPKNVKIVKMQKADNR